jgi:hypothetical protein
MEELSTEQMLMVQTVTQLLLPVAIRGAKVEINLTPMPENKLAILPVLELDGVRTGLQVGAELAEEGVVLRFLIPRQILLYGGNPMQHPEMQPVLFGQRVEITGTLSVTEAADGKTGA